MKEQPPTGEHQREFTARDAAKDLIRPYVERGDDLAWLARGAMGASGPDYAAQIGGQAVDPAGNIRAVGTRRIAVTRLRGTRVFARFLLGQIYEEVRGEAAPGRYRQGRLF